MDERTGEWRKLHNEELNELYSSPNITRVIKSRRMRLAGHVVRKRDRRGVYKVSVRKPDWKIPFGRPTRISEHKIKTNLQEMGWRTRAGLLCLRIGKGSGGL
jgi:hypothetical protein